MCADGGAQQDRAVMWLLLGVLPELGSEGEQMVKTRQHFQAGFSLPTSPSANVGEGFASGGQG